MKHTLYFTDKPVIFADSAAELDAVDVLVEQPTAGFLRTKVLNLLETHNSIGVISPSADETFRCFVAEFAYVEAAGGVVLDDRGRWLMISRFGRWDFPKGHVEAGETHSETAVREIEEETGVRGKIRCPLCETWHAYYFEPTHRWEVKRTYWYCLDFVSCVALKPQEEEDIRSAVWCSSEEVERNLQNTFPTICCVAVAMKKNLDSGEATGEDAKAEG